MRERVFYVTDNIMQPAYVIERNAMGVLIDFVISAERRMVPSDSLESVSSEPKWERACEFGHLAIV